MKHLIALFTSAALMLSTGASAEDNLKYFMVKGKLKPEIAKMLVDHPMDPTAGAKKLVASIKGAKLVSYYLEAGTAANIAIIAVPDSDYASAIVYQRMSTGALIDIEVREIIPAAKFEQVMQLANDMNKAEAKK
ncbi:hypothetical protein RGQ13_06400 [Thalassotalea psychrophila]|uniref:GYD domain-containing protein n=1 Tax=Thalassotalea psychrophila TaxID=3065647 RepID=A0ABY9TXV3_9GAMM|nr:hypothetical protein RGQ13_06400 [Colwelliaceae bacterium SQ149]